MQEKDIHDKEGMVRKRGGRMHQWSSRYFILSGSKLSYKLKPDSKELKGSFDLVPGCIVTEVVEESRGVKGKKTFSFWLVWPHDKHGKDKEEKDKEKGDKEDEDSGDEKEKDDDNKAEKVKDLKQIVETEALTQKMQKTAVEEQLERHHAHDSNVSMGVKVAAVAVGGVVVGALTAGIGLVPYVAIVGITAVAGGGAVAMQMGKRPEDSRLIIACDTMDEALEWKTCLQGQIARLERNLKPMLPETVDVNIISNIIDKSLTNGGDWKHIESVEGIRIMEQIYPGAKVEEHPWCLDENWKDTMIYKVLKSDSSNASGNNGSNKDNNSLNNEVSHRCCKAQLSVKSSPINAFLRIMNSQYWPKHGNIKIVKEIDDHVDMVGVEIHSDCSKSRGSKSVTRKMCLSRFWKLDDEGIYLITFNSATCEELPSSVVDNKNKKKNKKISPEEPNINAVITIAPRNDGGNYEYEVNECMVTCICQASKSGNWMRGELNAFIHSFIEEHLLELKHSVENSRFIQYDPVKAAETVIPDFRDKNHLGQGREQHDDYVTYPTDTPPLSRVSSLNKRGITTVQPGLDEDFHGLLSHSNSNNSTSSNNNNSNSNAHVIHLSASTSASTSQHNISTGHNNNSNNNNHQHHHYDDDYDSEGEEIPSHNNPLHPSNQNNSNNNNKDTANKADKPKKKGIVSSLFSRSKTTTNVNTSHSQSADDSLIPIEKKRSLSPVPKLLRGHSHNTSFRESSSNNKDDHSISSGTTKPFSPTKGVSFANNPITIGTGGYGKSNSSPPGSPNDSNNNHKQISPSKPPLSPTSPRKRNKKLNTEINMLRNQIGSTEYEIHRIEKRLKKKSTAISGEANRDSTRSSAGPTNNNNNANNANVNKTDQKYQLSLLEYNSLKQQLADNAVRLQELKQKYQSLTGEAYTAPRSTFSRFKFGRTASSNIQNTHTDENITTTNETAVTGTASSLLPTDPRQSLQKKHSYFGFFGKNKHQGQQGEHNTMSSHQDKDTSPNAQQSNTLSPDDIATLCLRPSTWGPRKVRKAKETFKFSDIFTIDNDPNASIEKYQKVNLIVITLILIGVLSTGLLSNILASYEF